MRVFRLFGLLLLASVLAVGCDKFNPNPSAPTGINNPSGDSGNVPDPSIPIHPVRGHWSPYVVVHAHGGTIPGQNRAIRKLASNGALRGIRIGVGTDGADPATLSAFVSGADVEILGIIGSKDLLSQNLEETLEQIYRSYPMISHFQYGNEIESAHVNHGVVIEAGKYMEIFSRAYNYTVSTHPEITLVAGATMTGSLGARILEQMVDGGLAKMDRNKVIISMNIYKVGEASPYIPVLSRLPGFEVWVTELGVKNPDEHIRFVTDSWPVIRSQTRAARGYWYANWAGDNSSDLDYNFGLITNALNGNLNIVERPLFRALTGGAQ